jgi:YHS domain-containing protein
MHNDPVRGMQVFQTKAAGTSKYKWQTYHFCSNGCKANFDAKPETFARQPSGTCAAVMKARPAGAPLSPCLDLEADKVHHERQVEPSRIS